jgi:hypothetical protein
MAARHPAPLVGKDSWGAKALALHYKAAVEAMSRVGIVTHCHQETKFVIVARYEAIAVHAQRKVVGSHPSSVANPHSLGPIEKVASR